MKRMKKSLMVFLFFILGSCATLIAGEHEVLGLGCSSYVEDSTPAQKPDLVSNTIQGLISLGIPCALLKNHGLSPSLFEGVKLVHVEGSRLTCGIYMEKSMHLAQSAGAKISLNLADADLIEKYRERIWALLETYTDILFINEKEAYALTHLPPERAADFLNNYCPVVVIKMSDQGCWVCSSKEFFHSYAKTTTVSDPLETHAVFTSAFLYGYLNGYSLKACASFGNIAGSTVCEESGGLLPHTTWQELKKKLS